MSQVLKYSVIIPAYNCEKTLARCLDSLLCQHRSDIQIIIVNDGSQDGTAQLALKYVQTYPFIEYIYQENAGVSVARNTGLSFAKAEYVSFVDSDDYVTPEYFAVLDQISDSDLLVFDRCGVGGLVRDDTAIFARLAKTENTSQRLELLLSSKKIMSPCNKCYKLLILKKNHISFPTGIHIGEDFVFCMTYALHCSTIAIDTRKIYCVDASDNESLSRKYRSDLGYQLAQVGRLVEQTILSSSIPTEYQKQLLCILDYLHVKNALVSIAEEFKHSKLAYFRYRDKFKEICSLFNHPFSNERYCKEHAILRLLLRLHMYFLMYALAYFVKGHTYRKQVKR